MHVAHDDTHTPSSVVLVLPVSGVSMRTLRYELIELVSRQTRTDRPIAGTVTRESKAEMLSIETVEAKGWSSGEEGERKGIGIGIGIGIDIGIDIGIGIGIVIGINPTHPPLPFPHLA